MALPTYDLAYKLLLVGDSGVGKSSLLLQYTDKRFSSDVQPTIGVDFKIETIQVNGVVLQITIWDTAGQEKFRSLTASYYRGAAGIIFVYDIASRKSFDDIKEIWMEEADLHATGAITKMIIGNKADRDQRAISQTEAKEFAAKHNMLFAECSSKTGAGIADAFVTLLAKIVENDRRPTKTGTTTSDTPVVHVKDQVETSSSDASYCSC